MKAAGRRFRVLAGEYAACRLRPGAAVPAWASGAFVSVTRSDEELSIVCPAEGVPTGVCAERGWRVLRLVGPLAFGEVGVLASFTAPLAEAGISLLAIATYDTDYVLVPETVCDNAIAALRAAGHTLVD